MNNILIIGDSYSTFKGYIPEGYAAYYTGERRNTPDLDHVEETWWYPIVTADGNRLVENNSWSGATIGYRSYNGADVSNSASFIFRLRKKLEEGFFEKNEVNTVLLFGGTNDSWCEAPLGEMNFGECKEEELYYVLPAICHFTKSLREALPDAKILVIINDGIKDEVRDALAESAARYGMNTVYVSECDKVSGHPTGEGMKRIQELVSDAMTRL